jgi:transposase
MRGSIPIDLTIHEKNKLRTLLSSEPPGSKLARNSSIIIQLADGKTITQVAKKMDICRQTVSEVCRRFVIFRLEGVTINAPRLGRRSVISGEKANEVLYIPLFERPDAATRWTYQKLAERCNLLLSTIYGFLKRKGVVLDDSRSIHDVIDEPNMKTLDIAGLLLSPSVLVMAFWCESRNKSANVSSSTMISTGPTDSFSAFFSRERDALLKQLEELQEELFWTRRRATDCLDILIFLKKLDESIDRQKDVVVIVNTLEIPMGGKVLRWFERRPRFHIVAPLTIDQWTGMIVEYLSSVSERNKKKVAFQLEHLVSHLTEWRDGPHRNVEVFASFIPLR